MKINEFHTKMLEYDQWMENSNAVEEDDVTEVTEPLQVGSKIRTKKMSMEGEVVRIGKTSYGTDEVIFKTADGRTMKTPVSNVIPIQKLQDGDGGGIGFNRSADQHVVSYEKVLDEIMKRWEEESEPPPANDEDAEVAQYIRGRDRVDQRLVDEVLKQIAQSNLNIYNVMNEPQDAAQKAAARVLTRMYDQVSNEHNIGNDDFEKISGIIVQQLQQKFGIHEEFDYVLERWNNFNEAPKKKKILPGQTEDEKYKGWNLRYQLRPKEGSDEIKGMAVHSKSQKMKPIETVGRTPDEVKNDLKSQIDNYRGTTQITSSNVIIDFNIGVASDIIGHGGNIYAEIIGHNGQPVLLLSAQDQGGMKLAQDRTATVNKREGQLGQQAFTMSGKKAVEAGLTHARYTLGKPFSYTDGIEAYPLIFHSEVYPGEIIKMNEPGVTVAYPRNY